MHNKKEDKGDKQVQYLKDLFNTHSPFFPQVFLLQNEKYITSLI